MRKLALIGMVLLFAVPADAAAPRILPLQDAWPTWSPDGTKIAFTRIHSAGNLMELELVDLGTHRVARLAQSRWQPQPSWSPDGTKLAYQSGGSIYVIDTNGKKRRIGPGASPAFGPGAALARVEDGFLYVGSGVWAADVIGRPAWAPDGWALAFRRDDGIYTTEGPGRVRLLVGAANPGDPVWSPDSSTVAFTIGDEIWTASRGLVPAHAIARAKPGAGTPAWSPDGVALVYTWRGGVTRTTVGGRSTLLHPAAGLGAAYGSTGALAYSGPLPRCPGHLSIIVEHPVAGSCTVIGTPRTDVIEGSLREGDIVLAGAGNDRVHANDGHTDRVDCGSGRDTVWADRKDHLAHCEIVHR